MSYLSIYPVKTAVKSLQEKEGIKRYFDAASTRHKSVMSLFPQVESENVRADLGVLFRVENTPKGSFFLIRSAVAPIVVDEGVRVLQEDFSGLSNGDAVQFRVTLNPIKRVDSKEIPIVDYDLREAFATNRLSSGLKDIHYSICNESIIPRNHNEKKTNFQLIEFNGVATISDVKTLEEMLVNGVGRSKNYGCGLLTVKPLI